MPRSLTVALACLALVPAGTLLAGCGDDDDDAGDGAPAQTAPASTEETGGTPAPGDVTISMKDVKNVPREAKAKVGQTIVWSNDDPFPHTVTAESGADFDSGTMEGGETFEYTAEEPGEIAYMCRIHPNQTGTVTVTE